MTINKTEIHMTHPYKAIKDDIVLLATDEEATNLAIEFFEENGILCLDDDLPDMIAEFISVNNIEIID